MFILIIKPFYKRKKTTAKRIEMFNNRLGCLQGCTFVTTTASVTSKRRIMNALRNKVQLIGRLGQDPDLKTLESGKKVAHFTLATSGSYKSADGNKVEETTWHSIVAWNGLAEIASRFLRKGREVCVEGRITYRTFTDKNGMQRSVTEIVASDMVLLSSRTRTGDLSGTDGQDLPSGLSDMSVDLTAAGEAAVRNGKTKSKVQAE